MSTVFTKRIKQNNFLCTHQHTAHIVKNMVLIAWILSLSLVINFFHLPIHVYGIEVERFEFGLIIPFLFIGIISLKSLFVIVFLLPFLDQLFHGHNVLLTPFEASFNVLALFFASISRKWFKKNLFHKMCFLIIALSLLTFFKFFYFLIILEIFTSQVNLIDFFQNFELKQLFISSVLIIPLFLNALRFLIIFLILFFLNKK